MMANLLPYLKYKHGTEVLKYFTTAAKEQAADDIQDPEQQQVICTVDTNAEVQEKEDFISGCCFIKIFNFIAKV